MTNAKVLDHEGIPNMFALLSSRRVRRLGHIRRIEPDVFQRACYDQLAEGLKKAIIHVYYA